MTPNGSDSGPRANFAIGALAGWRRILSARRRRPAQQAARSIEQAIAIGARYGFTVANMFHAGDGNLHPCVLFDERVPGSTERVLDAGGEILQVCVDAGGTITGEHGIGLEKRDYMPLIFSEADLEAMGRLKTVFHAGQRFNPCKAFPTTKGCGEVHLGQAMAALGPDAFISPDAGRGDRGRLAGLLEPDRVLSGADVGRYPVDGCLPSCAAIPETVAEVSKTLRFAGERGLAVIPWGSGTLIDLGNKPSRYDIALVLTQLNEISDYSPEDLVVTVQAGATIAGLNGGLARQGQFLALDPPRADLATIGGALSAGLSGPLRQRYGGARDLVIGLTCVLAGGEIVHSGGRVVKNVAGYDLNKLFLGAIGSAGVIVEASFKLYPLPAAAGGLSAAYSTCAGAHAAALRLINSRFGPTAVEIAGPSAGDFIATALPSGTWLLAAQSRGMAAAVERQQREMAAIAREAGAMTVSESTAEEAATLFGRIRDFGRRPEDEAALILRCALLPSEIATAAERLVPLMEDAPADVLASAGGTLRLIWRALPVAAEPLIRVLRSKIESMHGTLTIERCPQTIKDAIEIWGISGPDLMLMGDLKAAYDPLGTLSPGRYVGRL